MSPETQQDNLDKSQDRGSDYSELKSWYLARLRKQALALHEKDLTPAGLIRADRSLIESLVVGSSAPGSARDIARDRSVPTARLLTIYVALMFLSFMVLLNAESGDFPQTMRHFFQLNLGTLFMQGSDHTLFARIGWLAYVLPSVTFGTASLLSLLVAPLNTVLSRSTHEGTPSSNNLSLPGLLAVVLTTILSVTPALVLTALGPDLPQSDPGWHIVPCLSAWGLLALTILTIYLSYAFFLPLHSVLDRLSKVTGKPTVSSTGIALQDLVHELVRGRDELANREMLIADASPDLLLVLGTREEILCSNWTSRNLLGYLPEELRNHKLSDLLLPQDLQAARQALLLAQESKQAALIDCRFKTRDAKAVDMRCALEYSATRNCFFVCARDVSDQKTLERAKREFVSMLGHDIRLPLGSALLTVQALEQNIYGELPDKAESMLSEVELSLKRLVKLLEELLEFEQLSAGKMPLDIGSLKTAEIISQALSELSGQLQKKKVSVEILGDSVQIEGDAGKLLRVVVNLVSNAVKFSLAGGKITVLTQRPRTGTVEIRITDQGPGIAPEYQKLVFERYERLETQEQGRGLGLAIARSIVESHGGLIGVESQIGQGSTFWFTLPVSPATSQEQ